MKRPAGRHDKGWRAQNTVDQERAELKILSSFLCFRTAKAPASHIKNCSAWVRSRYIILLINWILLTQHGLKPRSCLDANAEGVDQDCRKVQYAFFECKRSLVRTVTSYQLS